MAAAACTKGVCDGSGWILGPEDVARPCECQEQRRAKARSKGVASVIPRKFQGVSFERPPVTNMDPMIVRFVNAYCEDIDVKLDEGRGLWLMGDTGTGKTTLAMLVSKAAIRSGRSVAIYSLPKLLSRIRRTYDGALGEDSYMQLVGRLTSVDLLHIDDFGAEKSSDWVLEQLYSIVNERYEAQRAMVVTTNLQQEEMDDQIGKRTVSRLVEMCGDPLPLFGEDRRIRAA